MKISEIYTRKKSNQGVTIPIPFTEGQTISIYGIDSDIYKDGMRVRVIENARILTLPESEWEKAHAKADLELVARMICSWSFEEKCTHENRINLLQNSPGIFELVDKSVFKRELFMGE